jgi:DNA topoisomerase-1
MKSTLKNCDEIILATDEDREGEAISWHLLEILKPKIPFHRAVFHEITEKVILDSFANPRKLNVDIVASQEARRMLDRLVGFTLSPILWKCVGPNLSAGRVQTCGLYLCVEVGPTFLFLLIRKEREKTLEFCSIKILFIKGSPHPSFLFSSKIGSF